MCGIAGIVSPIPVDNAVEVITKMTRSLAHRGPDGEAHWMDESGQVVLGHRRLAIIDTSPKAAQPMHYRGRYSIIHNGEIYNYLELREDLAERGYSFDTESDTEVILAAFDCWGRFCADHFDGMFAFAIWDAQENRLFAMRDRFGEKPFYYSYDSRQGSLSFASEPKALWAAGIARVPDESMWLLYLGNGAIGHPSDTGRTYFKNVRQLEPGHLFYFTPGADPGPVISRYWKPAPSIHSSFSEEEAISRFHSAFYESVARRMRADVTIGTSLSGGIDSSSVLAMIHHQSVRSRHYQQQAFTAVFPGFDRDEGAKAREVAGYFQVNQQETFPDAVDFVNHIENLIRHHEEPVGSASIFAQFKTFQLARNNGVTVLLDGQGADEVLAGYTRYDSWFLQELLAKGHWSSFRKEKKMLDVPWSWKNTMAAWLPSIAARQLGRIRKNEVLHAGLRQDFVQEFLTSDLHQKPVIRTLRDILSYTCEVQGLGELLRYADRNSMYHGVEVRLPFLEQELVSLAFQLPPEYKIRDGYHKWILRKAMEGKLPSSITWQKNKIGFEPPQEQWMSQDVVTEMIREGRKKLVQAGILEASVLDKKIQPHSAYAADNVAWRHLVAGLLL